MGRSRNTAKESVWANARIDRTEDSDVCLPRIVARRPAKGDIHPLPKNVLTGALRLEIPTEYLYGLARIELRAREGNEIGNPFGKYCRDEKTIILYSLPTEWTVPCMPPGRKQSLQMFGAEIQRGENSWCVRWPDHPSLGLWFFAEIVTHELGHHFSHQYRNKRGKIRGRMYREMNADLHSLRLTRKMSERWRRRRRATQSTEEA
ncbi:MAG: hypothetical protein JW741_12085 [Sedimentisphaerales bacterium]|nr:hypothetical protein [Sedimentisphaerales bacterium]